MKQIIWSCHNIINFLIINPPDFKACDRVLKDTGTDKNINLTLSDCWFIFVFFNFELAECLVKAKKLCLRKLTIMHPYFCCFSIWKSINQQKTFELSEKIQGQAFIFQPNF